MHWTEAVMKSNHCLATRIDKNGDQVIRSVYSVYKIRRRGGMTADLRPEEAEGYLDWKPF